MSLRPLRVLSPTAILGYGFPEASFRNGLKKQPDLIGVDAGSTDPGPYYLGAGKSFAARPAVKRDLEFILKGAMALSIPCIIGTAGGAGAREHVRWTEAIIAEIAREQRLRFRMGVIGADVSKDLVLRAMQEGRVRPLSPAPELTADEVAASVRIVAQMGPEPVIAALENGCQVVLCGRCYDPVAFAAPAIQRGYDVGLALHLGKILECAAIAATPGSGSDCVLGTLFDDCFELESLNPQRRFTRISTAAHTLYEKTDPYRLPGPGGTLDLSAARFEALEGGRVRVSGTRFEPAVPYTLKLEGVKRAGFRTISLAGIADPVLISCLDAVLDEVKERVREGIASNGRVLFHVYGRNQVLRPAIAFEGAPAHDLGVVMEAVADDQETANAICSYVRSTLLHFGYPGRIATAGNLALLYSPSDIPCGEVFEFNIYHLLEVADPESLFPIEVREVGA